MKLIIVKQGKVETFERLTQTFANDRNVRVVWDRRTGDRRQKDEPRGAERRHAERDRRRLAKPFEGRDYIVIHTAEREPEKVLRRYFAKREAESK